jgi:dienelactone hydrolase
MSHDSWNILDQAIANSTAIQDNYAKAGFYCYIPDVHQGDSLPIEFLNSVEPPLKAREQLTLVDKTKATATVGTTLPPWLIKHREAVSKPLIDSFIKAIRAIPGTGKVGAIGFCWGGRYAILAAHGEVDAAYACHPSLISVPADFDPVTKPLSLAVGDKDSLLDNDTVGKIQDLMAKKTDVPHELRIYEDQIHGFALRSDWSSEKDRKAMDESEQQGVEFFNKFLA